MRYEIDFSEEARSHLRRLPARDRAVVVDRVESLLADEPTRETHNLKRLRPNPLAKYELRIGRLRVFFDTDEELREVLVLAVGQKQRNRLWIAGNEVAL